MDTYPQYMMPQFSYSARLLETASLSNLLSDSVIDPVIAVMFTYPSSITSVDVEFELGGSYKPSDSISLYISDTHNPSQVVQSASFDWETDRAEFCGQETDLVASVPIQLR